ncbi:MAG: hypothetical protein PHG08_00745 [Bacilli bacterium]|nr:hypothetical protein [Bacilli bacterium]
MALWGAVDGTEDRPKWLAADTISGFYDLNKVWADEKGWNVTRPDGSEELLVAIGGLATKLGTASIVGLEWGSGNFYGAGEQTVIVAYNEKITVAVSHPTLVVTGSVSGSITATHSSTSSNRLIFTFTIPDGVEEELSIGAQSITLAGGSTITDTNGTADDASVVISAGVAAGLYPSLVKAISLDNPVSATWSTGTFVQGDTNRTLTLVYEAPVTVGASGTANTIATLWSGTGGPAGPDATYASGSGTVSLVFNLAAIPSEAGTLSIATQTIGGTKTLKDANGTTVNKVISSTIATATGTKVVAA